MVEHRLEEGVNILLRRYHGATLESLMAVLCPLLIPIRTLDRNVFRVEGQSRYRASFTVALNDKNRSVLQRGRTGKFIPGGFGVEVGVIWREIAKGRIIEVDVNNGVASGEVYTGSSRQHLERERVVILPTRREFREKPGGVRWTIG